MDLWGVLAASEAEAASAWWESIDWLEIVVGAIVAFAITGMLTAFSERFRAVVVWVLVRIGRGFRWLWRRRPVAFVRLADAEQRAADLLTRAEAAEGELAEIAKKREARKVGQAAWQLIESSGDRAKFGLLNTGNGTAFDVSLSVPAQVMMMSSAPQLGDVPGRSTVELDAVVTDRSEAAYSQCWAHVRWFDEADEEHATDVLIRFRPGM